MIKVGLYGYGNISKGVECAVKQNKDMEVTCVFTRRNPETVSTISGAKVYKTDDVLNYKDDVDVLVMCGGSATDLPEQTPTMAEHFNVVDSFDTHKRIPEHFAMLMPQPKMEGKSA